MMAEKTDRSDEVIEFALDRAEKNDNLVQDDLPGNMVTNTAPGKTLRKLSPMLELDPGSEAASTGSSDAISSSTTTLSDIQDAEDACAGIILNCLFCQFYDLCLTLPDTCKRATYQICPACSYLFAPLEPVQSSDWNCHCDIDCDLFDACQESSNCLELAMEISEICYR